MRRPRPAERQPAPPPRGVLALGEDPDVGDLAGRAWSTSASAALDQRHVLVEVERLGPARSRPGGRRPRRRGRSRARDEASTVPTTRPVAASTSWTGWPPLERMSARSLARRRSVQNQPRGPAAQQPGLGQLVDGLAGGRAEQRAGRPRSAASSCGGRAQVRARGRRGCRGRRRVASTGRPEQRLGVVDEVGVERVVAGDQHAERVLRRCARPGRPAATATRGCRGSRPSAPRRGR